jgi:pimeloyl-ACP methyl ester carboxylesterase
MRTRPVALGLGMVAFVLADLRSRASLARRSRIIRTANGPIELEITGDGPGVLVLHGGLGGFDQGSWIAQALDLRAHRVVAVSRPGYLGTPDVGSLDAEADLYVAALDALGIERIAVVGVSGGGVSTLHLARRHPQRVTRVVMLSAVSGPAAGPGLSVGWFALRASVDVTKSLLAAALDPAKRQLVAGLFRTFATPERRVRGGLRDLRLSGSFPPPNGITVAALVVHGTADDAVPFEHAERTVRGCTSATLIPMDGGRHLSLVTHAEVRERVREFLTAA